MTCFHMSWHISQICMTLFSSGKSNKLLLILLIAELAPKGVRVNAIK